MNFLLYLQFVLFFLFLLFISYLSYDFLLSIIQFINYYYILFSFLFFPLILQVPSATRKLQLGFFGSEILQIAAPNFINFQLLISILKQIHRLTQHNKVDNSNKVDNGDDNNFLLYNLQYCILRILKSNFLRIQEQQKNGDEAGLVYFPLTETPEEKDENNNGSDRNDENQYLHPYSNLPVFQLLCCLFQCISGEKTSFFV